MAEKYNSSIPLMPKNEAHVRVARLAVAIAVRLFSTDKSGRIVKVLPKHVKAAGWVYAKLLKSPELEYTIETREARIAEEAAIGNEEELRRFIRQNPSIRFLLRNPQIRPHVISHLIGGSEDVSMVLDRLVIMHAVKIDDDHYSVNDWARKIAQEA